MTIRIITPRTVAAALVATALITSACSSEPEPLPKVVAETTTTAPPTSAEAPRKPSACDDPASENLGDGFYARGKRRYELIDGHCLPRFDRPEAPDTTAQTEGADRDAAIVPDAGGAGESEPDTSSPASDEVAAPITTAMPTTTSLPISAAPSVEVAPPEQCPAGQHADGSSGCHPDHGDTPTTTVPTTTVAPDGDDPWERAQYRPVLASELYPGEDVPANRWCWVFEDEIRCLEATEPDSDPEPEPEEVWVEPYAGYVPPVHPDTEPASWDTGEWEPGSGYRYVGNDHPRATPDVEAWTASCTGGSSCDWLLYAMKWALDYLGAEEDCVVAVYHARWRRANSSNWQSGAEIDLYGWHRCPTVIDPRTPTVADPYVQQMPNGSDVLLLAASSDSLADRCRAVLPADVELEFSVNNDLSKRREGLDCDEWAALAGARRVTYKTCDASALLAEEWMEHHHGMPVRHRSIRC